MVTAFASCKKTEQTPEPDQTTESTTTETTTEEDSDSTLSPAESKNKIIGTWVYDETISPQKFYGDYYNSKITKTNVQMSTTYKFNKDGTYSTTVEIINISDVRKEYRSLMVEGARRNVEKEEKAGYDGCWYWYWCSNCRSCYSWIHFLSSINSCIIRL